MGQYFLCQPTPEGPNKKLCALALNQTGEEPTDTGQCCPKLPLYFDLVRRDAERTKMNVEGRRKEMQPGEKKVSREYNLDDVIRWLK